MSAPESLNAGTTGHAVLLCVDLWLCKAWAEDLWVHCILWAGVIPALQQKVREIGMVDENEKETRQTLISSCFSAKLWMTNCVFIAHANRTGDSLGATQTLSTSAASWVPATCRSPPGTAPPHTLSGAASPAGCARLCVVPLHLLRQELERFEFRSSTPLRYWRPWFLPWLSRNKAVSYHNPHMWRHCRPVWWILSNKRQETERG